MCKVSPKAVSFFSVPYVFYTFTLLVNVHPTLVSTQSMYIQSSSLLLKKTGQHCLNLSVFVKLQISHNI